MKQAVTARHRKQVFKVRHAISQAERGTTIKVSGKPIYVERLSRRHAYIYIQFNECEKRAANNRPDFRKKIGDDYLLLIDLARIAGFTTVTEKKQRDLYVERLANKASLLERISQNKEVKADIPAVRTRRKRVRREISEQESD